MKNKEKKESKIAEIVNKDFAEMILKNNKDFENEYLTLYSKIKSKYEFSFESLKDSEKKIQFLENQMKRILEANFDMKNNFNISEIAEQQNEDLKDLFDFFECELNKIYNSKAKKINLKNSFPNIFASDFAFTLFHKMHDIYKLENHDLANYSFLFYAMQDDGFIISKGVEFKNLLTNYDIIIDKIDSRQSGSNSKRDKYELYKTRLETLNKTNT